MDGHDISAKEFTELALGICFDIGIQDANRLSAYGFCIRRLNGQTCVPNKICSASAFFLC